MSRGGARCGHCGGEVQHVGRGRTGEIHRCKACGRSPGDTVVTRAAQLASAGGLPVKVLEIDGRPCPVDGCPGTVVGGKCACCAKRMAYAKAYAPKHYCRICEGEITKGQGGRKFCKACTPIAKRAAVAAAKSRALKGAA